MRKFRVIKIVFALTLTVAILLCSSVFVSAYYPLVSIESDEWDIASETTYSAVYPNRIDSNYAPYDGCYSYSELNGDTYYGSRYWVDDYPFLTESAITIPNFPEDASPVFGQSLKSMNKFVFVSGYDLIAVFSSSAYVSYSVDCDNGDFDILCPSAMGEVVFYRCSYPYVEWKYDFVIDFFDMGTTGTVFTSGDLPGPFSVVYSSFDLYKFNSSDILHKADNYDVQGTTYTMKYEDKLTVLTGALSFELSLEELKFLNSGACCVRIDDIGMIAGMETAFLHLSYSLYVYDSSGNYVGDYTLFLFDGIDSKLEAGTACIKDSVSFENFSVGEFDASGYTVELIFVFVTDGYGLFFPGTFEIIEFESYEDDIEHEEVLSSIHEASSVISGEISFARSELSSEIVEAASNITTSINNNFAEIMHGDTGYAEPSFDTSGIDNIISDTDSTLDDVFATLDDKIFNNLPSGYSSFDMYLKDNVDSLNTRFSYAFLAVRNLFDRLVGELDISILILFSLVFGFAMYVLGRRLNHD